MSQETGLWSVRRPRETLGGIHPNTAIPNPGSTMKRSSSNVNANFSGSHGRSMSGSRQSLAMSRPSQPMFGRASTGPNLADSARRVSALPARPSHTPAAAAAARASTENDRRSTGSVYRPRQSTNGPAHHQSFFQTTPQPAGVPRDPRPLRDRAFQARIGQELMDYMTQGNFEMEMKHVLSQNVMKSPTQKDFNYMFQWLYHQIDPNHRFQKNIDQEVPPILKQLRYPFERSITKSQIAAVGGQNWSTFLGLLHWMMQLAQMLEGFANNKYEDACAEAGLDVSGDHIIFDFLSHAYKDWLAMDEDMGDDDVEQVLAPHIKSMAKAFERSNSRYVSELEMLEAENARLLKEIEDLEKSTPDPATLDNNFKIMEEDKVKFEEYNTLAMQRSEKYESRAQALQEELVKLEEELKEADEERKSLQKSVDAQGISMQDIDRMTAEREYMQKSIETASQRLEDIKTKAADREAEASAKLEDLERMVEQFNTLAYKISVIPSTAVNARGQDLELHLLVSESTGDENFTSSNLMSSRTAASTHQYNAERLLLDAKTGYPPARVLNLDLRGEVKHTFQSLQKDIQDRRTAALNKMQEDEGLLMEVKEALESTKSDVDTLNHRVRAAQEEYERLKESTTAQKMTSDAQIEKMEKDLGRMRAGLTDSGQLLEQREINTTIEYEQLILRRDALREELHTEIDRMLNDVIKFKIHIQGNLDDYENFVTDELEKHLGSEAQHDTRSLDL